MFRLIVLQVIVASGLDREQQANHTVLIRCKDGGDPKLIADKTLIISITDSNDNAPEFTSASFTFHVPENKIVGTWVGKVRHW